MADVGLQSAMLRSCRYEVRDAATVCCLRRQLVWGVDSSLPLRQLAPLSPALVCTPSKHQLNAGTRAVASAKAYTLGQKLPQLARPATVQLTADKCSKIGAVMSTSRQFGRALITEQGGGRHQDGCWEHASGEADCQHQGSGDRSLHGTANCGQGSLWEGSERWRCTCTGTGRRGILQAGFHAAASL